MSGGNIETGEVTAPKLPPITKKRKKRVKRPKTTETEVIITDNPTTTANTTENGQTDQSEIINQTPVIEPEMEIPERPDNTIIGICVHRTDHLLFSVRKLSVKGRV